MPESFKTQAAKFAVPLLVGLIPSAFFVGKAYGGDAHSIADLSNRMTDVETEIASASRDRLEMKILLARIDERVGAMYAEHLAGIKARAAKRGEEPGR